MTKAKVLSRKEKLKEEAVSFQEKTLDILFALDCYLNGLAEISDEIEQKAEGKKMRKILEKVENETKVEVNDKIEGLIKRLEKLREMYRKSKHIKI